MQGNSSAMGWSGKTSLGNWSLSKNLKEVSKVNCVEMWGKSNLEKGNSQWKKCAWHGFACVVGTRVSSRR